ncbi:hypothetical protein ISS04_02845 [Candidatus Woesearchaeota archaeon]|nr:hypothetical protein [Candidatus Woesearchaeota archaeon]
MWNKKGDWEVEKSLPGLILGLLIFAMGIFPLLNKFGVIDFNLPYTPVGIVLEILLTVGGIYLMIMGFMEDEDFIKWVSIIAGIIVAVMGVIPLLANFGISIAIPFLGFLYSPILYVIVGLIMIIGAFFM